MNIINIISALGGLALFLYGMSMLGTGLEKVSGGLLEAVLKKLTSNIFLGVLFGAVVTAAIQSSGATTVIVIGLVNAGLLKLRGAIGIIMGANIGTTITAQILRLTDLEGNADASIVLQLLKPSCLSAVAAIAGLLIFFTAKKSKRKTIGEILMGFSILFTGMLTMESSIKPLAEMPEVSQIFASLENPFLGVIAGAVLTALLQSSSVSVGILQALSTTGVITFSSAFPIIMGQNIGACITTLIASVGANKNAKRAAMIHLYFNVIGTVLYLAIVYTIVGILSGSGVTDGIGGNIMTFWNSTVDKGIIANFHAIFNISVTILFIPFAWVLEKLALITIRDKKDDKSDELDTENLLDERFLSTPAIALSQAEKTLLTMAKYAQYNFRETQKLFTKYDAKAIDRIKEYENTIDLLDDRINNYLVQMSNYSLTAAENRTQTFLLHLTAEFERIGDYAFNLMECADALNDKGVKLSEAAMHEITTLYSAVDESIEMAITAVTYKDNNVSKRIESLEEVIDVLEETIKARHIQRFKSGQCGVDAGIALVDSLTNLERIGDHCANVAAYIVAENNPQIEMKYHTYLEQLHISDSEDFAEAAEVFSRKYRL